MSPTQLVIMGAGSAEAEHLIRPLHQADSSLVLLGCNDDRFVARLLRGRRDMDTEPVVLHADDFFDGVHDVSSAAQFTLRPIGVARS